MKPSIEELEVIASNYHNLQHEHSRLLHEMEQLKRAHNIELENAVREATKLNQVFTLRNVTSRVSWHLEMRMSMDKTLIRAKGLQTQERVIAEMLADFVGTAIKKLEGAQKDDFIREPPEDDLTQYHENRETFPVILRSADGLERREVLNQYMDRIFLPVFKPMPAVISDASDPFMDGPADPREYENTGRMEDGCHVYLEVLK